MIGARTTLVLLVYVAGATAANHAAWAWGAGGPVRLASNAATVFSLPAWVPMALAGFGPRGAGLPTAVAAHAAAGILWIAGFRLLWTLCRRATDAGSAAPPPAPVDASRRAFLTNSAAGIVGVGAVATPGYATMIEPWRLAVRREEIPIHGLDPRLDGLRIVHFTDPHLGPRMPESFIARAVRAGIDLRPDLVAFTGDYVHEGEREIERAAELLGPLARAASVGAVGVLGNHDWWSNGPAVSDAMTRAGVRMIDNARLWLDPATRRLTGSETPGALALVGLGDLTEDGVRAGEAFSGVGPGTPRVVLAHQPDTAEIDELSGPGAPRIDLMLCGHTHGGQVRIPFLGTPVVPSKFGQKYAGGLVQGPACPVLVSRGVGLSVLPIRLGVPPEIGLVVLRSV